jgi:hypothetical protein
MKDFTKLALLGLATYRATKLVIDDEITAEIREKVLEKLGDHPKLSYLLHCPWCVSIWLAGGLVILDKVSPEIGDLTQKVLAASAITGLVDANL